MKRTKMCVSMLSTPHVLSHHSGKAEKINSLRQYDESILKNLNKLLDRLKENNLYDETIVFLTASIGNASSHHMKNVPGVLFGGGLKHQGEFQCKKGRKIEVDVATVHNTILKQIGLKPINIQGQTRYIKELV